MIVFKRLIILFLFDTILTEVTIKAPAEVTTKVFEKTWEAKDNIPERDKEQITWLCKELVRDAKLYMRQLKDVVDSYSPLMAFEVGVIMGKIREKLKLMTEIYRQIRDRYTHTNKLFGPAVRRMRPMHYILIMEEIHRLEVDIDKYVSVLENIPDERWEDEPVFASPLPDINQRKKKPKSALRIGSGVTASLHKNTQLRTVNQSAVIQERQLKSKLREQFLMRRLGLPANQTTTKKRFIENWPVEDTWSLEQYSLA